MTPSTELPKGRLWLVPAPLDFGCDSQIDVALAMPMGTLHAAAAIRYWVCENAKSARAYLKRIHATVPLACPLQDMAMQELPHAVHKKGDHMGQWDARSFLAPALQGHDMGLLSEAGMPAVADPGSALVRAAHDLGVEVVPLVGPVSILLALAASGLNGQSFSFVGYLPQEPQARHAALRQLENTALQTGQTQLFIETPYRNLAMWQSLLAQLRPTTRLSVGAGLTLPQATVASHSVQAWRSMLVPVKKDQPAVFALGA